MSLEGMARYALRHCRAAVAAREDGVWHLGVFRYRPRVVGFRHMPASRGAVARYARPSTVFFAECPSVEARQKARAWADLNRAQTSWTDFVFGKDPLFPRGRPIVLLSPPPRREEDKGGYLEHARVLVPQPPLVCLRDGETLRAAASVAGATLLGSGDVSPEEASAKAGSKAPSLLAVGDGFAEFSTDSDLPTIVVLIGPDHEEARHLYEAVLAKVLGDDAAAADTVEEEDRIAVAEAALSGEEAALLKSHTVYLASPGTLFPLA